MPLLSDTALERLASWIERNVLKDDGTILRESRVQNASGGFSSSWVAVGYPKVAVLSSGDPNEAIVAAQTVGSIPKLMLLPRGTDIRGNDRVMVGQTVYHVVDVFTPETFEVTRRVSVRHSSLPGGA